ncbi:hypothetical protein ACFWHQ_35595 [Streptomyces sp. NPDC060334]|uniref:hypothetical protein n=1 Tax=Streptomyces sp. NPDC060334 TaxID=3347099 RepID=UPI00365F418B
MLRTEADWGAEVVTGVALVGRTRDVGLPLQPPALRVDRFGCYFSWLLGRDGILIGDDGCARVDVALAVLGSDPDIGVAAAVVAESGQVKGYQLLRGGQEYELVELAALGLPGAMPSVAGTVPPVRAQAGTLMAAVPEELPDTSTDQQRVSGTA